MGARRPIAPIPPWYVPCIGGVVLKPSRAWLRVACAVLGRVVAVLFGLELVYFVAANAVLRSSLIKHAVDSADGMHLEYDSASSVWPSSSRRSTHRR